MKRERGEGGSGEEGRGNEETILGLINIRTAGYAIYYKINNNEATMLVPS